MIRKEVIFIVRALNYMAANKSYGTSSSLKNNPYNHRVKKIKKIHKILINLKDHEKRSIMRVIKSGVLLTGGQVAAVRDPEAFEANKTRPWWQYMNNYLVDILTTYKIADFKELEVEVTKEDYRDAKRILPIIGASSISDKDADIISRKYELDKIDVVDTRKGALGNEVTTLYRGLRDMSAEAVIWLTKKKSTWNLKRGVSTSFDKSSALNFAGKRDGYRIVIAIENKDRVGFQFDDLSKYSHEDEIIFSGNLLVKDDWKLTYRAPPNKNRRYQSIATDGNTEIWTEDVLITSKGANIKVSLNGRYADKIEVNLKGDGSKMVKELLNNELEVEIKSIKIPGGKAKVKIGVVKTATYLYVNTMVESKK